MKSFCFQLNCRTLMTFLIALLAAIPAFAQTVTVQGTVTDEQGEPIIGANVLAKGTAVGQATDFDGKFSINVPKDAVLQVSYIGYLTQEVAVNGQTEIKVVLKENSVVLDEVVALGYGAVKKEDATGSVSVVKPDEIEAGLATSAQDLLVGKSPGVVVTSAGGDPQANATIRIRGGSSLNATNDPLIVIDGVPIDNTSVQGMSNPLAMVSPDNVESMTVLKDASATAIYGSRASNGVIIITTKKGKSGKPQVNFSANMYVNKARKTVDVLTAPEFREVITNYWGAGHDATLAFGPVGDPAANRDPHNNAYLDRKWRDNHDWQDDVLRTSVSHDYNLSVGGAAGILPYRVSVNYTQNNGIVHGSSMDRLTAGINLTPKFFDGHLSVQLNAKGYYFHNNFVDGGGIVGAAIAFDPTQETYYDYPMSAKSCACRSLDNGYFVWRNGATYNINATENPVALMNERDNYADVLRSNGNLQLDYAFHFLPDLHANLNLGYDWSRTKEYNTIAENSPLAWKNFDRDGASVQTYTWQMKQNTLLEFYLNYKKQIDAIDSNIDFIAGYSWQHFKNRGFGDAGTIMSPGYLTPTYDNATGEYTLLTNTESYSKIGTIFHDTPTIPWVNELQLLSFYGRLNYMFKDTYLLTVTLRDDASSRFSEDTRWGLFPAVALGWKISNMSFMKDAQDVVNELKLRLGWGVTGQQDIPGNYFPYLATYQQASQGSFYPFVNPATGEITYQQTLYPGGYVKDLKWEETTTYNAGIDVSFLNNRINASLDWYLRDTKDLLCNVTVPIGSATTNEMTINVGTMRNIGLEFAINAKPIVTKDFTWTIDYNVGWNKNEITKLNNTDDPNAFVAVTGISGGTNNLVQAHKVGYPAFTYYLFEQVYDEAGNPIEGEFVDQDGNGAIDDNDRVFRYQKDPKVTMSMSNTFNYKNWDFGLTLRANFGAKVYNNVLSQRNVLNRTWVNTHLTNLVDTDVYFTGETGQNLYLSDYYLRNGDFLRVDNITLGYTWKDLCKERLRLRLYGAVQNPFVITKYNGLDPETFSGIDNNVYPRPTTYTLGLVATF